MHKEKKGTTRNKQGKKWEMGGEGNKVGARK